MTIKESIQAINNFVPKENYLSVKKENGTEHLELIHATYWNRFLMQLGWSSACMHKVIRYIQGNHLLQNSAVKVDQVQLLNLKIENYEKRTHSFCNTLFTMICWFFSLFSCCRKKEETSLFVPSQMPNSAPIQCQNQEQFIKKFEDSAPKPPPRSQFPPSDYRGRQSNKELSLYCQTQRLKMKQFLSMQRPNADLIYICIGHGNVDEQVWPGFVLEQLQNGKTVHTLLFEMYDNRYPPEQDASVLEQVMNEYERYPRANQQLQAHLNSFCVNQFLCGFPSRKQDNFEDKDKGGSGEGFCVNSYFTKQEIEELNNSFKDYVEHALKNKKRVVFGYHCDGINHQDLLVVIYNDLIKQYPNQLYFLWGWEGANNCITAQPIKQEDTDHNRITDIWKQYPKDKGGLSRCDFTSLNTPSFQA